MLEEIKLLIPVLESATGSVMWVIIAFLIKDALMHLLGAAVALYIVNKFYVLLYKGHNLDGNP